MEQNVTSADELLEFMMDFGQLFLTSGAEISRVEDALNRIGAACGAERVEAFVITSLLSITIDMPDGCRSRTRRIRSSGNDLSRIEEMNALSRRLCSGGLTLSEARGTLDTLEQSKPSKRWLNYLGSALAAGSFTIFFQGNALDALFAGLIGLVIAFFLRHLPDSVNLLVRVTMISFFAGILTLLLSLTPLPLHPDPMMIGEIMLLIPGLSWSSAIRELFNGDTISGSLRLIQSLLLAVMIAFGFAAALLIMRGVIA